jgi:hypothetical protein
MEKPITVKVTWGGRIPLTKEALEHIHAEMGDTIVIMPSTDGRVCLQKLIAKA